MEFYSDESSQDGHKYLVLGTLAIQQSQVPRLRKKLQEARTRHNHRGELCWTKVSSYKFGTYVDWLEAFAEFARLRRLRFTALTLDTSQVDHAWNGGDRGLGFNKLIYQMLLHRVGKRYGALRPIDGYLDQRTTNHSPEKLREILNAGLAKTCGIKTNAFRRLQFRDSKECDLIQLTDILTGCIAFHLNGHARKSSTRKEKIALCQQIRDLRNGDPHIKRQFNIWPFHYKGRSRGA